jgi:hypothetical protein
MIKTISLTLCAITFVIAVYSQEKVTVKKGTIYSNKLPIAEFDGKGGAMKSANYKITPIKSDSVLITIKEKDTKALNNPLYPDQYLHMYDLTFATHPGKSFVLDVHPYISKFMGKVVVNYRSKWGTDLLEEIFNDSVPLLISDGKLITENVEKFIANVCYPYDQKMAEIKQIEDSIGIVSSSNIPRDIKKPVVLQRITNPAADYTEWYNIVQDNVVIGQLHQLKIPAQLRADYEIWKKTTTGMMFQNKKLEFVPIAMIPMRSTNMKQEYEAIKVSGKERFIFKTANPMAAELDIINTMVSMGIL